MAYLGKDYKFEKQENFDGFLKAIGVPEDRIAKILEPKHSTKIVKDGDTYSFITDTSEGAKVTKFQSGVPFQDTIEGSPVKATYTVNGNVVTQVMTGEKGDAIFKGEYNADELVVTITLDNYDGVAKRWYRA